MLTKVFVLRFRRMAITCAVVVLLAVSGCADLNEITQFAKASQDVGKTFPTIADEADASCTRANNLITPQNQLTPLNCQIYAALKPSLLRVNAALFNYIASLGKLASADLSKVPGGFDTLSADVKAADPGISPADQGKVAAAGSLAKAITNLWANGYRQHELSKIIGENDKAVQQVTEFLSDYAAGKFHQSLKDEERFESFYCINMKTNAEPLADDLLRRKCDADQARIDLQLKAVESYQSALKTIADTHEKLNEEREQWDAKKLAKVLGPGIASLEAAAVSVNKAF
jgi:hypothetical protein